MDFDASVSKDFKIHEALNFQFRRLTGKDLNPDTLNKAIESTKFPADMFGADDNTFSATKHLGTDREHQPSHAPAPQHARPRSRHRK